MPEKRWGESDQEFQTRAAKENLVDSTGMRPYWGETDEEFIARAGAVQASRTSGLDKRWGETDEEFVLRASKSNLVDSTGMRPYWGESDQEFVARASMAQLREVTGLERWPFETDEQYRTRAIQHGPKSSPSASSGSSYSGGSYSAPKKPKTKGQRLLGALRGTLVGALCGFGLVICMAIIQMCFGWLFENGDLFGNLDTIAMIGGALLGAIVGYAQD